MPATKTKETAAELTPQVVTTDHKGVFFGYAEPGLKSEKTLKNARMCVYWSSNVKGVLGLAFTGPLSGSKISPAIPSISLNGVTSVMQCTPEAVDAWEKSPWD